MIDGELARGTALLVLDGLDELGERIQDRPSHEPGPDPRAAFVSIIPANNEILITSRLTGIDPLSSSAPWNGAVTLRALDDAQIDAYLERKPDLMALLQGQAALRDALRIPLLLSLFAVAFAKQDAQRVSDLSTGGIRDAIFEQFILRRYEHEARKPHATIPFSLDEVYDRVGSMVARVSPYLPGGGHWHAPTLISDEHIRERFGDQEGASLTEFLLRINLLVPTEPNRFRFLHLLLRDHLAFRQASLLAGGTSTVTQLGAMIIFRQLRDPRSVAALEAGAQHARPQVRWEATAALANLHDASAIGALIRMLDDALPTHLGRRLRPDAAGHDDRGGWTRCPWRGRCTGLGFGAQ